MNIGKCITIVFNRTWLWLLLCQYDPQRSALSTPIRKATGSGYLTLPSRSPRSKRRRVDTPTRMAIQANILQPRRSPGSTVMVKMYLHVIVVVKIALYYRWWSVPRFLSKLWKTLGQNLSKRDQVSLARNALKDACIRENILIYLGKYIFRKSSATCAARKHHLCLENVTW